MDNIFGIGLPEFVLILVIAGMVMGPERILRTAEGLTAERARLFVDARSAPSLFSTAGTSPSSCSSRATSRWAGVISGFREAAARRCAVWIASWDFTVNLSGCTQQIVRA